MPLVRTNYGFFLLRHSEIFWKKKAERIRKRFEKKWRGLDKNHGFLKKDTPQFYDFSL